MTPEQKKASRREWPRMRHKNLQNLVCFAIFRKEPTLDEMNDRAEILAGVKRVILLGMSLIGIIILWSNL